MKSTGEVMGVDHELGAAFAKAKLGAGTQLPQEGAVFVSVNDHDKAALVGVARDLARLGFRLVATGGTAAKLGDCGLDADMVYKVNEGRPNVVDFIKNGTVQLIINTPLGRASRYDEVALRKAAMRYRIPTVTTIAGARALVEGIRAVRNRPLEVAPLQACRPGAQ
jgi:carbamoyl-phosphate synthase large subunit